MKVRELKFEQVYDGMLVRSCNDIRVIGVITAKRETQQIEIHWDTKSVRLRFGHTDKTICSYKRCDCEIVSSNSFFFISKGKRK